MDVNDSKNYRSYDSLSRYSSVPYYYNRTDGKYVYGVGRQLDDTTSYILHTVEVSDTFDSLALKYYGRPDYFWIIADFNHVQNPFLKVIDVMDNVKIPALSSIKYKD